MYIEHGPGFELRIIAKKTTLGTTTNKQNSDCGELECSLTNYLLNLRYMCKWNYSNKTLYQSRIL